MISDVILMKETE